MREELCMKQNRFLETSLDQDLDIQLIEMESLEKKDSGEFAIVLLLLFVFI
jgi:hypothetical protein